MRKHQIHSICRLSSIACMTLPQGTHNTPADLIIGILKACILLTRLPADPGNQLHSKEMQTCLKLFPLTTSSFKRLAESSLGRRGGASLRACRASQSRPSNQRCRRTSSTAPGPMPRRRIGLRSSSLATRSCACKHVSLNCTRTAAASLACAPACMQWYRPRAAGCSRRPTDVMLCTVAMRDHAGKCQLLEPRHVHVCMAHCMAVHACAEGSGFGTPQETTR